MDTFYLVVVLHKSQRIVLGPYLTLVEASIFMVDFCAGYLRAQYQINPIECTIQLNECFMDDSGMWQTLLEKTLIEESNDP